MSLHTPPPTKKNTVDLIHFLHSSNHSVHNKIFNINSIPQISTQDKHKLVCRVRQNSKRSSNPIGLNSPSDPLRSDQDQHQHQDQNQDQDQHQNQKQKQTQNQDFHSIQSTSNLRLAAQGQSYSSPPHTHPPAGSLHRSHASHSDSASVMTRRCSYSDGRETSLAWVPFGSSSTHPSLSDALHHPGPPSSSSRPASLLNDPQSPSPVHDRRPSAPHLGYRPSRATTFGHPSQMSMNEYCYPSSSLAAHPPGLSTFASSTNKPSPSLTPHTPYHRHRSLDLMDPFSESLASCKSIWCSNPAPIKTCTRKDSKLSDRERDAPDFVRALSSDVSPDAPSLSSSDSHSHYRSSIGSFSLRCPLLDPDRHASETAVLAMHPLPALTHERSPVYTYYNPSGVGARLGAGPALSAISSTCTTGGNLFVPLRRRFLPNTDRVLGGGGKARVETQLLGELLLALEEYVAAFGRQVKAIPARQFGSAAVVVVAATAGLGLIEASLSVKEREWQGQTAVEREALGELCAELEHVTREVVDAVPAFGEKLMQGHYGPLAVQGTWASDCEQAQPASALARFADYEPGGPKDTSEGGAGWWAERLLRDLVEGIVAETVVKSASANMLLSGQLGTRRGLGQSSNNDGCRAGLSRAICEAQQAKRQGKARSWTRSLVQEESEGSSDAESSSEEERRPAGEGSLDRHQGGKEALERPKSGVRYDPDGDELGSGGPSTATATGGGGGGVGVGGGKNHQFVEPNDSHHKELLDQGRRRWLAFKAKTG